MLSQELKQFIRATSGQSIIDLCSPLTACFGINYLLYVRDYKDGRRIWLTTNGPWTEYFYEHELYQVSAFEKSFIPYTPGYYLWKTLPGQQVFNIAREFNIDHGVTVVSDHHDYYEFFHFASTPENAKVLNFYVNYPDALQKFMAYFVDQAKDLIKKSCQIMIDVPQPEIINVNADIFLDKNLPISEFLSHINSNKYYLKTLKEEIIFTKREKECLQWLLKGKSMCEIGLIEGISKRTVEVYAEQVKRKLGCYKSFQMGYKLAEMGFV